MGRRVKGKYVKDTAWDQYLGHCKGCKQFGALDGESDLCMDCRIAVKKMFDSKKNGVF